MEITYGTNIKLDSSTFPEATTKALLSFGVAHFLGNVQASKIVGRIRGKDGLNKADATKEAVKAWREANPQLITKWSAEFEAEALKELVEGKIGVRAGGPRLDPVEAEFKKLVMARIKSILEGVGMKMPKAEDEVLTFGDGVTRTLPAMVRNVTAKEGDSLRKTAEANVAAAARRAKQAKDKVEQVKAAGTVTADALGI